MNFTYPELIEIPGQSTYVLLKEIKDKSKSNISSVSCDLGGGANEHLGLVLTPAEYATISPIPYIQYIHPAVLVIPPGTPTVPQYLRAEMRDNHKKSIRLFRKVDNVDKAFKRNLQNLFLNFI